ncbi:methyl-accepting chemotaxis protein [Halomonas sp. NO4]|uniref:methyl-accepting chemotaxis protein n=1 Tax=Halomonas sp. NO4 TaxID=2484813 RepID=UPI0013D7343D|nr:methyl-accepting chemotaxis protein [Halomonas sp. NO4]
MKRLDNMTVRTSWTLVLVAFSTLILAIGGLGLAANQVGREAFATLNETNVRQERDLNAAYNALLRARVEMDRAAELLRTPSFDRPGPVIESAEALLDDASRAFQRFLEAPHERDQQALVETLEEHFRSLHDNNLRLQLGLLQDADVTGYLSGQSRVTQSSERFIETIDAFFDRNQLLGQHLAERFGRTSDWLNGGVVGTLLAALALIAVVVWGVRVNVLKPLRRIVEHFQRIAAGDLATPVERRGNNEIGQLFAELATMQRSLTDTVGRVLASSERVHHGSLALAEGNQSLASQTQQQASALEQTASSLEELTATVAQNAEHAQGVSRSADDASAKAREGDAVIQQFLTTMEAIHGHSDEIQSIIGLIESIAFQTNILALNASVEAARAGDQGRGFAVVATEVRDLATRSASAAKEIRSRIQASSQSIEQGNALSREAAEHTRAILVAIERVSVLMGEISRASSEQRHGIEQVNQAMLQMETTTQDSARLVEGAAGNAAALADEAQRMHDYARRFSLTAAENGDEVAAMPAGADMSRWLEMALRDPESRATQGDTLAAC